jgi:hypothetical protein
VVVPKPTRRNDDDDQQVTANAAAPTKTYTVQVKAGNWFADYTVTARNERHAQSIALGLASSDCPNNLRNWLTAVC